MRFRSVLMLGVTLLFGSMAFAQDDHKIDGTVDYSYVHANPQNNNIIPTFSLHGVSGSIAYYFTKMIGIEGEFEGYGSYAHNFTVPPPYCNGPCAVSVQGNLFTYNVGPIVKLRLSHFEPFVETLFGGAHSNLYGNLYTACTPTTNSTTGAASRAREDQAGRFLSRDKVSSVTSFLALSWRNAEDPESLGVEKGLPGSSHSRL